MSLLVVVLIAGLVFFYVRGTRQARLGWLRKLDLPGRWLAVPAEGDTADEAGDAEELILKGQIAQGDYVWVQQGKIQQGRWRVSGSQLELQQSGETSQVLDLHLFKPGQIGLEDQEGRRRLFHKALDNVVPLRRRG